LNVQKAAVVVAERAPGFAPRLGIILGSGLGAVADALGGAVTIPYGDLPGFPQPGIAGHAGALVLGTLSGLPVAILQGRRHVYEGGDPGAMRVPVRALRQAGAEALLVTNAAGSLRAEVGPGSLMAISDHINMLGVNPLTGPNDEEFGPRFPSLRDAYDPELRATLHAAAGSPRRGRASRRRPRSARSARSARTPSACRRCRR
jgi:xanthosine phosphorylase